MPENELYHFGKKGMKWEEGKVTTHSNGKILSTSFSTKTSTTWGRQNESNKRH